MNWYLPRVTLIITDLTILLLIFSGGCTLQPYWNEQSPAANPSPTTRSPSAAPVPLNGWQEYDVIGTVNIRTEPNTSSPSIGALYAGAVVRANCHRTDGFCEVLGGYVIEACLGIGDKKCQNK